MAMEPHLWDLWNAPVVMSDPARHCPKCGTHLAEDEVARCRTCSWVLKTYMSDSGVSARPSKTDSGSKGLVRASDPKCFATPVGIPRETN